MSATEFRKLSHRRKEIAVRRMLHGGCDVVADRHLLLAILECAAEHPPTSLGTLARGLFIQTARANPSEFVACMSLPRVDRIIVDALSRSRHSDTTEFMLNICDTRLSEDICPPRRDVAVQLMWSIFCASRTHARSEQVQRLCVENVRSLLVMPEAELGPMVFACGLIDWIKDIVSLPGARIEHHTMLLYNLLQNPSVSVRAHDAISAFLCDKFAENSKADKGWILVCITEIAIHAAVECLSIQHVFLLSEILANCRSTDSSLVKKLDTAIARVTNSLAPEGVELVCDGQSEMPACASVDQFVRHAGISLAATRFGAGVASIVGDPQAHRAVADMCPSMPVVEAFAHAHWTAAVGWALRTVDRDAMRFADDLVFFE